MFRSAALAAAAAASLAAAAPAGAASTFTIRGAGFGHGIGMSQYGAMGMARHGWTHQQILAHYFTGTGLGRVSPSTVVRVLLASPSVARFTGATAAGGRHLSPRRVYGVRAARGGRVTLLAPSGRRMATVAAPLRATRGADGPVTLLGPAANGVTDGRYRGWMEFRPGDGGVLAINAIGLEQYVAGVVSAESPGSWPLEALEAQAIAARGYAITSDADGTGYDQFADTRSQMYRGVAAETPRTNQAVNGTRGEVVTYHGDPVTTYFFSTSGGRTENIEDAWPGSRPEPWLRSVSDPYDRVSPYHRWGPIRMTLAHAGADLGNLVRGRFRGIRVLERGGSPRIVEARVLGSHGATTVTGAQLRTAFGLRDTWMTFDAVSANVRGYHLGRRHVVPPHIQGAPAPTADVHNGGAVAARAVTRTIAGEAHPGRRGTRVALQRRTTGGWRTVRRTRLDRRSRYAVRVDAPGAYRVLVARRVGPTVRVR